MWPRSFSDRRNFMSPSPNWLWKPTNPDLPISTTPPHDESELGSVDFELWKEFGTDILIKSTVTNHLMCTENGGSFVNLRSGPISCNVTKVVVEGPCENVVPFTFEKHGHLLALDSTAGAYYEFDTGERYWPISDPCGRSGLNQLTDVENPGGWLFVREKELITPPDVIEIFDADDNSSKYKFMDCVTCQEEIR